MLPEIKEVRPQSLTFPTAWQTVIFRNFSYVRTERIAAILGCSCEVVKKEAKRLGLSPESDEKSRRFERQGYITVIRNNWDLLEKDKKLIDAISWSTSSKRNIIYVFDCLKNKLFDKYLL